MRKQSTRSHGTFHYDSKKGGFIIKGFNSDRRNLFFFLTNNIIPGIVGMFHAPF